MTLCKLCDLPLGYEPNVLTTCNVQHVKMPCGDVFHQVCVRFRVDDDIRYPTCENVWGFGQLAELGITSELFRIPHRVVWTVRVHRWLPVCRHENQPDVGHFAVSDTGAEMMGDGCYFCVEMYARQEPVVRAGGGS